MQDVKNSTGIDLKGSVEIIADYFYVAINNILYLRGIYPEESFKQVKKFNRYVMTTVDDELNAYLTILVDQLKVWLVGDYLKRLVLVVKSVKGDEIFERWQFNICKEKSDINLPPKRVEDVNKELGDIVRQIVSSTSFLPILSQSCTFDLLVYTDRNADIPEGWAESGPCFIPKSEHVQLRSFSTRVHKVESIVTYRCG